MSVNAIQLIFLLFYISSSSAISNIEVNLADNSGVQNRFIWSQPDANGSCTDAMPEYVDCNNALEKHPILTRHTATRLQAFTDGGDWIAIFGGRTAGENPLLPSPGVHNELYIYYPEFAIWNLFINNTDVVSPPSRQSHISWSYPLLDNTPTDIKLDSKCGSNCLLFIHGGYGSEGLPLSDLWFFFNNTWTEVLPINNEKHPALAGHSVVVFDKKVYLYGGYGVNGLLENLLWEFDVNNGTWSVIDNQGTYPTGRAFHTAVLMADVLQSKVGVGESSESDLLKTTQQQHVMMIHGGEISDGAEVIPTNQFWKFDFRTMSWSINIPETGFRRVATDLLQNPFPVQGRSHHVCIVPGGEFGTKCLCFGGWSSPSSTYLDAILYDLTTNRLEDPSQYFSQRSFPSKLFGAAAVSYSGSHLSDRVRSFIIGGTQYGLHGSFDPTYRIVTSDFQLPLCAAGTFSPDGDWMCFPCPVGHHSLAYDCIQCLAGTYVNSSKLECTSCPPGTFTDVNGTADVTGCLDCPAATQLPAGGGASISDCEPCPVGSYSNTTGTAQCALCPAGTQGVATGAGTKFEGCEVCPYGSSSHQGSSSCTSCPAGTESGPFVKRLWPFALAVAAWGRRDTSCPNSCPTSESCMSDSSVATKCYSCHNNICGSCGPSPTTTYYARAGEVLYFRLYVYDQGQLLSSSLVPYNMVRLYGSVDFMMRSSTTVTVEKEGGDGTLLSGCTSDYPTGCSGSNTGTVYSGTAASNECRSSSGNPYAWHFAVRLDTLTSETTLVFRSEALLAARITLRVVGNSFFVTQQPPNATVATQQFTVGLLFGDVSENADLDANYNIQIGVPQCAKYFPDTGVQSSLTSVMYQVDGGTSTTTTSTYSSLVNGKADIKIAISGAASWDAGLVTNSDPDGTQLLCTITFTASGGQSPSNTTFPFFVQQPHVLKVRNPNILSYPGEPLRIHVSLVDSLGEVVTADNTTEVLLETLRYSGTVGFNDSVPIIFNASIEPVSKDDNLNHILRSGETDFFVRIPTDQPVNSQHKLRVINSKYPFTILFNDSIFINTQPANATHLAMADPALDPSLQDWPSVVMSNTTISIGIEAVDDNGNIDSRIDMTIHAELLGCSDSSVVLEHVNDSTTTPLVLGRALFHIQFVGSDSDGCFARFYNPSELGSEVKFFDTPVVKIRNPITLDVTWDVPATCVFSVGITYTATVVLRDGDGTAVTWAPHDTSINMTISPLPDENQDFSLTEWGYLNPLSGSLELSFSTSSHSNSTMSCVFYVGGHTEILIQNITYAVTGGFGSFETFITTLGSEHFVDDSEWKYIEPVVLCSQILRLHITATRLVITQPEGSIPWHSSGDIMTLEIEAQDAFDNLDDSQTSSVSMSVKNCEGGLYSFPEFYQIPLGGDPTTISGHVLVSSATQNLVAGKTVIQIYGLLQATHYEHGDGYKKSRGARYCRIVFSSSGLSEISTEPFELVQLSETCHSCPLGSWSPGGDGSYSTNLNHPGGCTPCMAGTYSTKNRASAESDCEVCPSGWGYSRADARDWDATNYKPEREGLSSCLPCPGAAHSSGTGGGGSCTQRSVTPIVNRNPTGGRIGVYCVSSLCSGCGLGLYSLKCTDYTTEVTCLDISVTQGNCYWASSKCVFADQTDEPVKCIPCPAGTHQASSNNVGGISSCGLCLAGSYSSNTGHYQQLYGSRDPRACYDTKPSYACIGDGTGQCHDGMYGVKAGMSTAESCIQCPAGTWVTQQPLSLLSSNCATGNGYPLPVGTCDVATGGCGLCYNVGGTCQPCTSNCGTPEISIGMDRCYLCPPGTYSTVVASASVDNCVACPPGFYCPGGTDAEIPVDYDAVQMHFALTAMIAGGVTTVEQQQILANHPGVRLGTIPQMAYSIGDSTEPIYCDPLYGTVPAVHDAEGFVHDGHFSRYFWKESSDTPFGPTGSIGFTDYWNVAVGQIRGAQLSTADHSQPQTMMWEVCSSIGGTLSNVYFNSTTGMYYCCPSECGGTLCGSTSACYDSEPLKSKCCSSEIYSTHRTCGISSSLPCFITGSGVSGSLLVNATSDRVMQLITPGIENTLPISVSVWGRNHIIMTDDQATGLSLQLSNVTYGLRVHFFDSSEAASQNNATVIETLPISITDIPGTATWTQAEVIMGRGFDKIHTIGIEPFVDGAYEGYVLFDDISVKTDPSFACNCSLGFFYNRTRAEHPDFDTPCQRCHSGFACSGGVLKRCPSYAYAQGGSYQCLTCPNGWLCDYDGRGSSTPCPEYTYATGGVCKTCPLGSACKDGIRVGCNSGKYGDGSRHCKLCLPGYYASANETTVTHCRKCLPGYETNYMRTECTICRTHSYSHNGDRCESCPVHQFTAGEGSSKCLVCNEVSQFPDVEIKISRNVLFIPLTILPEKCIPAKQWRVMRYEHLSVSGSTVLGEVEWSNPPAVDTLSVTYLPVADALGTDSLEFVVTSSVEAADQRVNVLITIENNSPVAASDQITISHPTVVTQLELTSLLQNDFDIDSDELFIADFTIASQGAHGITSSSVTLSSDRKKLSVAIPANFRGPMSALSYRVMDKYVSAASCLSPSCLLSGYVYINITAKDAPPVAFDDIFVVTPSKTTLLDVLSNDVDSDGDLMKIISTTKATTFGGIESVPKIVEVCPLNTAGTACSFSTCDTSGSSGVISTEQYSGLLACTCQFDSSTIVCSPQVESMVGGSVSLIYPSRYFIEFSAPPTFCGNDTFQYTTTSNEDASTTATVTVSIQQCVCDGTPVSGLELIFLLDGTDVENIDHWSNMKEVIINVLHRLDFSGTFLKTSLMQLSGSTVTTHRVFAATGVNLELQVADKIQNPGILTQSDYCVTPPCSDYNVAFDAAKAAFVAEGTSYRKVLIFLTDHPPGNAETRTSYVQLSLIADVYILAVGVNEEQLAANSKLHKIYQTHYEMSTDEGTTSELVDLMCSV